MLGVAYAMVEDNECRYLVASYEIDDRQSDKLGMFV